MGPRKIFNWLIAVFVAAGLLVAPLPVPVMAATQSAAVADNMQSMMDDMPCCPGQHDQKSKDCSSCPFVALCMLTIPLPSPDSIGALVDRTFSRSIFALPDDLLIEGLAQPPPDHPPRIIV